jgi:deazaflavin-dependent oxidoreductase (nitroreductase family)
MPLTGTYERGTADWASEQVDLFESTNGAEGNELRGRPVIVMTSVGAKSGNLRKIPLMRVEHEGEYVAVASLGGAPKHPTWYFNLKANPHVELQDRSVKKDYLARELEGAERDLWWERSVATWPDYVEYTKKTDRVIPLFLLTPITDYPITN